eukprot:980964_1
MTLTNRIHGDHRTNVDNSYDNQDFTLRDIRAVLPAHLFKRSYLQSFYWLFHDIILIVIMYCIGITYLNEEYIPYSLIRASLWLVWWYVQGAFFFGIWVIAHECGHHGFTPNKVLNNVVGFVVHTLLLVPYFAWQYTHSLHHSNASNLDADTAWNRAMSFTCKTLVFYVKAWYLRIRKILVFTGS